MGLRPKTRRGWLFSALALVVVLLLGYVGWIAWLYKDAESGTKDPSLDEIVQPPPAPEGPFFALLVGSDSREGLTEAEQDALGAQDVNPDGTPITGERADTLILARVDPEADQMIMVQIPRDFYVTFPDGSTGKINAALERSTRFLVETVEDLTGLGINRYAQVNIAGFRDLVDAIGGIDVCVAEPIPFDENTGFEVPPDEVGMVHLDGERALRYARTRYVLAGGDFDRIANQQKLLAAAIQKAANIWTVFRPDRISALFGAIKDSVKTDSYSSLRDMKSLAERFRALDEDKLSAYIAPNLGTTINEAGDVVVPAKKKLDLLFGSLESGEFDAQTKLKLSEWELDIPVKGAIPAVCRN